MVQLPDIYSQFIIAPEIFLFKVRIISIFPGMNSCESVLKHKYFLPNRLKYNHPQSKWKNKIVQYNALIPIYKI